MKLFAFLFSCYLAIASVMAKSYSSLLINGNDKKVNLYVKQDSQVGIRFTGNSGGYYDWNFDNIEDLESYDIEVKKGYDYNSGVYGVTFDIADGTAIEELPTLQFTYKDSVNDKVVKQVQVTLKESTSEENHGYPFDDLKIYEDAGERDLYVRNGFIEVRLYTSVPVDRPLTTGYSWYLDNADMLKNHKIIKFLRSNSYYRSGSEMECIFEFKVNEIAKEDILPALIFSLKQSSDDSSVKAKSVVNLRVPDEKSVFFSSGNDLKQSLNVNKNETIIVELDGNPSTGYKWYLENADEIRSSEFIEPLNLKKNGDAPAIGKGVAPGSPAVSKFKFYIKETVESDQKLPTLKFIQSRNKSGSDIISTAELSLKVKKERNEEKYDPSLPVYNYEENEENILYIESNCIVTVKEESNASTGHQWFIDNLDEIERSDVIDYIGSGYQSSCGSNCPPGSGGIATFSYRIWDVTSDDELPMIKMSYRPSWSYRGGRILKFSLKLKKEPKENLYDPSLPVNVYKPNEEQIAYVESNSIFKINEIADRTAGFQWTYDNSKEIEESNVIDYINSTYKFNYENEFYYGAQITFNYRIWDITDESELPKIKLTYRQNYGEGSILKELNITLKLKNGKEEEPDNSTTPVFYYEENDDEVVYVEKNSILKITQIRRANLKWNLTNAKKIEESNAIEYIGSDYESTCTVIDEGCGGWETFSFRILDVTNEDELPKITYYYQSGGSVLKKLNITIKLKNSSQETEECSFDGYPCCTKADAKVLYEDNDGQWSVENGDWCFIKKQEELRCDNIIGYPCCENNVIIYTDNEGDWGYENDNWCYNNFKKCCTA